MAHRRDVLAQVAAFLAALPGGALTSAQARAAWHQALDTVPSRSANDHAAPPAPSEHVSVGAPDVATDASAVPIVAATTLPGVRRLYVVVEQPSADLCAVYDLGPAVEPSITTRVRIGRSAWVSVLAQTGDGRLHLARKHVRVTLGSLN